MLWRNFHRRGELSDWWHYVLPPESRHPGIFGLVDEGRDLVVTGPVGVGKTTLFLSFSQELRNSGRYAALFVRCRPEWTDPDTALESLRQEIVGEGRKLPRGRRPLGGSAGRRSFRLREMLSAWSLRCDGQAVLFLDDLSEVGSTGRLAILRQVLRCSAGSEDVPLHLVAILGSPSIADDVRQIKDEVTAQKGSPLEERRRVRILEIGRFQALQVGGLYELHTVRTDQVFTKGAKDAALALTQGDPGQVNALASEALRQVHRPNAVEGHDIQAAYDRLYNHTIPTPRDEDAAPRRLLRPGFLRAALLAPLSFAMLLLGATFFLTRSPGPDTSALPIKDLELKKISRISEPESFEELCADLRSSDEKFEACRKKLPVFERTFIWIDTDLLVKPGEALGTDHLGLAYGVSKPKDGPSRQALAAILVSECLAHKHPELGPSYFDRLFYEKCRNSLPSLAHLGLEIDPTWLAPREDKVPTP